jgi:spoIIIJ-associated protein
MEESTTFAKKYLEDLLSFFGLNTDVRATHEDEVIELSVPSTHLNGFLIGQHGDTLRTIQYLVSNALKNNDMPVYRVNVDIADYKRQRNDRLARKVEEWVEKIKSSGKPMELKPMTPAERRIVHKTVSEIRGVETDSVGEGKERHVVITPYDLNEGNYEDEDEAEPKKEAKSSSKSDENPPETEEDAPDKAEEEKEAKKDSK